MRPRNKILLWVALALFLFYFLPRFVEGKLP